MSIHELRQFCSHAKPIIELSENPAVLAEYGKDWSGTLPSHASAVLFPRSTVEVSELLKFCNEQSIAVVPSGGRTGLSGGAIAANGEVVLSVSKMNRILRFDATGLTLELDSGVITEAVHHYLEPHGLVWPVDFASKG
ncbi:MAG: FAD-binding oxidoreductase, partial [Proteobacteria bacterium]